MGEGSTSDMPDGGELPHAQDRLWRHPAERGAEQAAANLAARKTTGRPWTNHIMSFIAGGAVVGLVWLLQTEPEAPVAQNTVIELADRPSDTVPDQLSFDVWVEDVARPNRMSVVSLHLAGEVENDLAQGVRLGTDGHLITSAHAIAGAEEIWASLPDGDSIPARLVAADEVSGVAVLKINATELPPPIFATTDDVSVGDQLVALSRQEDGAGSDARAIVVLGEKQVVTTPNGDLLSGLLRLSNEVDHNWAGSAVLEESGGIVAMTVDSRSGTPHAIPIEQAREVAVQLLESGTVDYRAWMGVEMTDLADGIKEERDLLGGVLLTRVWNETPSARAGLVAGDIIVGVGPVNVIDRQDLVEYLATLDPGQEVEVRYSRFQRSPQPNSVEQASAQDEDVPALFNALVTLGARPA